MWFPLLFVCCSLFSASSSTAANRSSASDAPFRLSRAILPSHYDLHIETHLGDDGSFSFTGQVVITLSAKEPGQKQIRVHSKDLEIDEEQMSLTCAGGEVPRLTGMTTDSSADFLVFSLDRPLPQNIDYKLRLVFSAPLGEGLAGYYRSSYVEWATGQTRWMAVTQFEPTDARRAFPCFDEPAFKATFNISMAHLTNYSSVSNMPKLASERIAGRDNWVVDHFERTERMSTYLVAFMVSDFVHQDSYTADNSTLFRVWARRESISQAAYAASVGPRVLSYYEQFFQVPYPLPKQDMVAIPDFSAGAMENWGLITYRERLLLVDPEVSSVISKRDVASVIAHELAHQWFGNLVTMKWWSDLWLNEGFATYVATLGMHAVHPNWNSLDIDALNNMLTVLRFDALDTSHPLSVPIKSPSEISQIFDAISYKKGSALIRMMSTFLGEEVFRGGLTNYLREHRFDNAEQDDLWAALTAEAHRLGALPQHMTVKSVMDTWTLQKGYPVLTVVRDYAAGTVNITQSKYESYSRTDARRAHSCSCWQVPLSYSTARAPSATHSAWLQCQKDGGALLNLRLPAGDEDWLLLNINATGLFRVLYDPRGWELLAEALEADPQAVAPMNRAQLVEDALSLAWSGDLPYRTALSLLGYLRGDSDYLPWKAALSELRRIYQLIRRTTGYGAFKNYLVDLLEEQMEEWHDMLKPLPADDLVAYRQRELIISWSCRLGVSHCVEQATALLAAWMKQQHPDDNVPIPPGLRTVVTCTALREGGEAEWQFVWQRYLASKVASEKLELLQALCCAREPWLLQRLLEWSAQEGQGIRLQDVSTVFSSVASNEYGFDIAKQFLTRNIEQLYKLYGPKASRLSRFVTAVAAGMHSEQSLDEFDEFTKHAAQYLKKASLAVKQARDKITVNVEWHRNHYAEVVQLLQELKV